MKKPSIRLYVPQPCSENAMLTLATKQAHYLANVMRVKPGDIVAVFNGTQGEWLASVASSSKKEVTLTLLHERLPQRSSPDMWLAFAPIKNKTEMVVEKATELGVSKIITVIMRHSVVQTVNAEKLLAHAIEASEQCERLDVPAIMHESKLVDMLAGWPADRVLFYGDESGESQALAPDMLAGVKKAGVLIGPEGGFSKEEHHILRHHAVARGFGMGPRILRADTAAIAALACMQSWLGHWQERPNFAAGA